MCETKLFCFELYAYRCILFDIEFNAIEQKIFFFIAAIMRSEGSKRHINEKRFCETIKLFFFTLQPQSPIFNRE